MRAVLLASVIGMMLVIWASHIYLTRAFSEDQNADATVRATLYAGSIQSTMQRHSVVPLLLSRDPILILALRSGEYAGAEERLQSFKEEIGAGSIFLLDAEGRIVAASDERPREQYDGDKAYFTAAKADTGTVFSIIENDDGAYSFHYARRIMQDEKLLGVVVVTVDLGAARGRLAAGAGQGGGHRQRGPGAARLRAELAAEDAVEHPRPRPRSVAGAPGASARRGAASARPSYVYIAGTPHLLAEVPVGFRNWRLTYFATLEDVRARVNAILSLIIMVLALLLALAFYLLSRRTRAESRRIQRESEELRVLNRRLSSEIGARKRVERNLKEAEQSLEQALEARRARPDVGRGQPRAEPAAGGDEDLSRRRAAAADPAAAGGGALLVPAHRRPDRPDGRHHPAAQVLCPQGRRRHRAGRPARQRARGAVDDGAAARQDVGEAR